LQICNGIEDCLEFPKNEKSKIVFENVSLDEKHCHDRFICNNSRPTKEQLVTIPSYKVCDGNIDCELAEDELEGK